MTENQHSNLPVVLLAKIPDDLAKALSRHYCLVSADAATDTAHDFQIAVTTAMRGLSAEDLDNFPDVKLVLSQGVGLDQLDLVSAGKRGVQVSVTPNILTEEVADFAIGLMYGIGRRVVEADRFVRAGRWGGERMKLSTRIYHKRIGIVGMGRIGQAIARRSVALGMVVAYSSQSPKDTVGYDYFESVSELAKNSDFLVLACPGGDATHHLCDAAVLQNLGVEGFLINISRGSVVDEIALIKALTEETIAGAALDVYESEPALDPRFLTLDNVVLTPHSASLTKEVRVQLIENMLADAKAFIDGKPLKNLVT